MQDWVIYLKSVILKKTIKSFSSVRELQKNSYQSTSLKKSEDNTYQI